MKSVYGLCVGLTSRLAAWQLIRPQVRMPALHFAPHDWRDQYPNG
jgi:hypothetical protein